MRKSHERKVLFSHVIFFLFDFRCVFITATINFWMPTWVGGCQTTVENYLCNDSQNKYNNCYETYTNSSTAVQQYPNYNKYLAHVCPSTGKTQPCCVDYICKTGSDYSQYNCPKNSFSQAGTVSFAFTEDAIKGFFHNKAAYSLEVLIVYFVCTFFVSCITYGIAVPSGLFVPCILMVQTYKSFYSDLLYDYYYYY